MSIDWYQIGKQVAYVSCVSYFAVTGCLMTRIITKVAISPTIGAISGAIFGVLCVLHPKKDLKGVFNMVVLNTFATLPIAYYYHAGNHQAIMAATVGLSALQFIHLIAIAILSEMCSNSCSIS